MSNLAFRPMTQDLDKESPLSAGEKMSIISRNRNLSLRDDERGGAMAESAFGLPIFLMAFLGVIGWNYFLFRQVTIQYAAEASARCMTMPNGPLNEPPYCGSFQSSGVQYALGLVSSESAFSGEVASFSYDSGNRLYSAACVWADAGNPLSFIPLISLPSDNQGSFCRPKF